MARAFKFWLGGMLLTTFFVIISILWFDRTLAYFFHDTFGTWQLPRGVARGSAVSITLVSAFIFVILGLCAVMGRRFTKIETTVLLSVISVLAAEPTKSKLKLVFGRTWPDNWRQTNLSLIHDGVYGFHPFHSGPAYESFPSGHATTVAAVASVVWLLYPELRIVCTVCTIMASALLVMLNFHFLSDVVAGTFVGISTGLFSVALWRASGQSMAGQGS
jgi:membrane-associated phospholipid phosphatase